MDKILYGSLYCVFYLVSLLPLRVLYAVSDGIYYILYYVVKYRRPLVRKHLFDSFPEKSEEERLKIEREFYAWLCDYFVETLKLFTMSEKQIQKRMKFVGADLVKDTCKNGQSCAVYLGHYCNWEWVTSLQICVGESAACGQIYHPLENKAFDKLFLHLRNRLGAICIPMTESIRKIIKMRQEGKPIVIGFIADQTPHWNNIHYWTNFLNHDTPVFTGTEKIAQKMDLAVYYLDMQRVKRGYYQGEFKLMTDKPKEYKEFEITEMYMRELEKTILRQPSYYLWTHNRWKRTRQKWLIKMAELQERRIKNSMGSNK